MVIFEKDQQNLKSPYCTHTMGISIAMSLFSIGSEINKFTCIRIEIFGNSKRFTF